MAKGKHAAALFEVIHSGRYSQKSRGSLLTPKWWFKRAKAADVQPPAVGLMQPKMPRTDADAECAQHQLDPAARVRAMAASLEAQESGHAGVTPGARAVPPAADESPSSVAMLLDRERQQITFKVTYTSALVTGFAVLVVVALAYVVGRKMSAGPALAIASDTTEQIRSGPANPDVLNVAPPGNVNRQPPNANGSAPAPVNGAPRDGPNPDTDVRVADLAGTDGGNPGAGHAGDRNADSRAPGVNPIAPALTGARRMNLNYIVIQSYPEEKGAIEARDALIKAGLHCTIEQGLRGLNPEWFSVVGTQGFIKPSGPECQSYIARIRQTSEQFAQNKRSFKAFQPLAYKWDKS